MPAKTWKKRVAVIPRRSIRVSTRFGPSPLHIVNNNAFRLAIKLKSTRSRSILPSVTKAIIGPNGGSIKIDVNFVPCKSEMPKLRAHDHLTIVMAPVPDGENEIDAGMIEVGEMARTCDSIRLSLVNATTPEDIGLTEMMSDEEEEDGGESGEEGDDEGDGDEN